MDTKNIIDKKDRVISLRQVNEFYTIDAYDDNNKIGSFEFDVIDDGYNQYLKVMNMHLEDLDGYLRVRIGTAIVN